MIDVVYTLEEFWDELDAIFVKIIGDLLEGYSYNGFHIRTYHYEDFLVKSYKYRPDIGDLQIDEHLYSFIDTYIYERVADFSEMLDQELRSRFDVGLVIVGRSGGYWGITLNDAHSLVEINEDNVAKLENLIQLRYVTTDGELSDENLVEVEKFIYENYKEYINFTKLEKCLDFIDEMIDKEEKLIVEDLKSILKEEKLV
jgi:hypothetical protein